ncbi:hypothetical protein [Paenibacillus whitsoniae]|uniref:Uncharacterized protein n=1 Tax=Paenibacillus whitsoniae TaxID=2496558 RepID=A0A430J525_9BACL|nr:hypothetical protein [Paenibacillus whitsoniae]RTE01988.1 hypothetical protein EJQ19_30340 [Paenibacillus whitsoniae]
MRKRKEADKENSCVKAGIFHKISFFCKLPAIKQFLGQTLSTSGRSPQMPAFLQAFGRNQEAKRKITAFLQA